MIKQHLQLNLPLLFSDDVKAEITESVRRWLIDHPEAIVGMSSSGGKLAKEIDEEFTEAVKKHLVKKRPDKFPMKESVFPINTWHIIAIVDGEWVTSERQEEITRTDEDVTFHFFSDLDVDPEKVKWLQVFKQPASNLRSTFDIVYQRSDMLQEERISIVCRSISEEIWPFIAALSLHPADLFYFELKSTGEIEASKLLGDDNVVEEYEEELQASLKTFKDRSAHDDQLNNEAGLDMVIDERLSE